MRGLTTLSVILLTLPLNAFAVALPSTAEPAHLPHMGQSSSNIAIHDLEPRDDPKIQCRVNTRYANLNRTEQGINYLFHITDDCFVSANGWARISCSYGSGIYWYNNNGSDKIWPCKDLGTQAGKIHSECADGPIINGKLEDTNNKWTIYIMSTASNEPMC